MNLRRWTAACAHGIVERVLFLRDVPIFRLLEPENLEQIADLAGERLDTAGEYLCREGELEDELFVLVEGTVEVSRQADGTPHFCGRCKAGRTWASWPSCANNHGQPVCAP